MSKEKQDLLDKLIGFITLIEKRNSDGVTINTGVKKKMTKYKAFRDQILEDQGVSTENKILSFSEYFKHIINNGNDRFLHNSANKKIWRIV